MEEKMKNSVWKKVLCTVLAVVLAAGVSAGTSTVVTNQRAKSVCGTHAKSAYDLAVDNGYDGTMEQWLASLVGEAGENGKSAYDFKVFPFLSEELCKVRRSFRKPSSCRKGGCSQALRKACRSSKSP